MLIPYNGVGKNDKYMTTNTKTIMLLGRNLFFMPRIQNVSKPLGYDVRRAVDEDSFWAIHAKRSVALVLVDLEGDKSIWTSVVTVLTGNVQSRSYIVAFGPHTDVISMAHARSLGCDDVFSKGEFISKLDQIIEFLGDK